jgi:hypothetical protein
MWPGGIGIGAVGLVDNHVSPHRKTPERCADFAHPGATYNPWADKTWCLCGEVVHDGNTVTHDSCCCGGRLVVCQHPVTQKAA